MVKNLMIWSKVILSLADKLSQYYKACDKEIDRRCSFEFITQNPQEGTYNSLVKLSELVEKKKSFIVIKLIIDEAFSYLKKEEIKFLKLRYIKGVSYNRISQKTGIPVSSCFRCVEKALNKFCYILDKCGYNEEYFQNVFGNDDFFLGQKNSIEAGIIENKKIFELRKKKKGTLEKKTHESYENLKSSAIKILQENNRNYIAFN